MALHIALKPLAVVANQVILEIAGGAIEDDMFVQEPVLKAAQATPQQLQIVILIDPAMADPAATEQGLTGYEIPHDGVTGLSNSHLDFGGEPLDYITQT